MNKNFGVPLSRNEMKNVKGGYMKDTHYTCNAVADPGYTVQNPGSCDGLTLSECQTSCNNWCNHANHCSSCACS